MRQPLAPNERPVVYCVVPLDLARRLHEPLRRHFADRSEVEVVVEQRMPDGERRARKNRRAAGRGSRYLGVDRRQVRSPDGRRVADRRALVMRVGQPGELPRQARPHADRLVFLERVEPARIELEDLDTARIVTRWQAGDPDAFREIYMRHFDRIYSYLRVILRDEHETEDVTQQVFLKALEALPRYERRPGRPFRAWLFTIARNHAINDLRRRNRDSTEDPLDVERQSDERVEADPREHEVLRWISDPELLMLIERLPENQRKVIALRYLFDLTSIQIAELLDFTPNQVRMLQHRAQKFLRDRLVALGREPSQHDRSKWRGRVRQAVVLRERRFVLQR